MRWNLTVLPVVGLMLAGCLDGKDTGVDSGSIGSGGGATPDRSIDAGACPESGLDGAADLPLTTVLVGAGLFVMGNDDDPDASPAHNVTLSAGVQMTVTEITQGQWTALGFPNPSQHNTCVDCPVEQVTWHEAAAYAEALSAQDGLGSCYTCTGSGADTECTAAADPYACTGWRLPTEAEWEAAAGEDATTWAGSDDFTTVGSKRELDKFEDELEAKYELKKGGCLGPGPNDCKELTVLNRVIRWTEGGIEYEADPRQAEKLFEGLSIDDG